MDDSEESKTRHEGAGKAAMLGWAVVISTTLLVFIVAYLWVGVPK